MAKESDIIIPDTSNGWAMHKAIQGIRDPNSGRILFSGYWGVSAGSQPETRQLSFVHSNDHFDYGQIVRSPFYDVESAQIPVDEDTTLEVIDSWPHYRDIYAGALTPYGGYIYIFRYASGTSRFRVYETDGDTVASPSTGSYSQHGMHIANDKVFMAGITSANQLNGISFAYPHFFITDLDGNTIDFIAVGPTDYMGGVFGIRCVGSDVIMTCNHLGLLRYTQAGVYVWDNPCNGSGPGQFVQAYDLCTDGVYIYVVCDDWQRKYLLKYLLSDGSFVSEVQLPSICTPRSIEYYNGYIYIPHWYGIMIFDTDLNLIAYPYFPDGEAPWYAKASLKFDGSYWWAIDYNTDYVIKFTITL